MSEGALFPVIPRSPHFLSLRGAVDEAISLTYRPKTTLVAQADRMIVSTEV